MTKPETTRIYFSDFFGVAPETLEEYGAFDVSLINDLPLFVDPFLLFNSTNPDYQRLHTDVIRYVKFLRDKAVAGAIDEDLKLSLFTFKEVRQNWLGYSLSGNSGSGLGPEFAEALHRSLKGPLKDFGDETLTKGSHLEKVCLISDGVGKDHISDFATNLIKSFLLNFTQTFATKYLKPSQRRTVAVRKAEFSYDTESWATKRYELPHIFGDYVLLTPLDLLTKDESWINKVDLVRQYDEFAGSIEDGQLRAHINNYFAKVLKEIEEEDERSRKEQQASARSTNRRRSRRNTDATSAQHQEAVAKTIATFPIVLDYFIRWKEQHGDEAEAQADQRVRASERLYIQEVRALSHALLEATDFYRVPGNTKEEARSRVLFLKDVIENKGGWRIFYPNNEPIRKESDVHILFRLTWCNTPSDVNREVNNGRGPSDFEVSRGRFDKSIVEFKLAKNSALKKNLKSQAEIYLKASDAQHALKVIVFFSLREKEMTLGILKELGLEGHPDVILIDARKDNKQSASKADSFEM